MAAAGRLLILGAIAHEKLPGQTREAIYRSGFAKGLQVVCVHLTSQHDSMTDVCRSTTAQTQNEQDHVVCSQGALRVLALLYHFTILLLYSYYYYYYY